MSPVSRDRKKKSGPASRRRQNRKAASPYAPILAFAERLRGEESALVAELWASDLLGRSWSMGWEGDAVDPEDFLERNVESLVRHMARDRGPAALAVLRALELVGEGWSRNMAREAANGLAFRGVKDPTWAASGDHVQLARAFVMEDLFGELELFVLGFEGAEGTAQRDHAIIVLVTHADRSRVINIAIGGAELGTVEGITKSFAEGQPDDRVEFGGPTPLTAGEVRARLQDPLDALMEYGPELDVTEETSESNLQGDPVTGWPLLRARLDALPEDLISPAEAPQHQVVDQIVEDFLSSGHSSELPDRELAGLWATMAADFAQDMLGTPCRWGPMSLSVFLVDEMSRHIVLENQDREHLPDVIRAWAHYTADARNLPARAHAVWEETLPALLADFASAYDDAETREHRMECSDALSLRQYRDGREARALVIDFKRSADAE